MARRRVKLIFPRGAVTQPVIYEMGHQFQVITNIRRADITRDEGWVVLEIEGNEESLDQAIAYCESTGVRVTPAEGDVVES